MRITDVKVVEAPLQAQMSNAVIDFSTMTVSMVAVYTDAVVDGEPVVGYGFHSNGRYAQTGLLTERFLPRLRHATPEELVDPGTGVIDPVAVRRILMANEKPGGHRDRDSTQAAAWTVTGGRSIACVSATRRERRCV
jgi:hypothetical protein